MCSVEWVKYLQEKLGGGLVFSQVIILSILKPNSVSICPTEKMLCIVPLIQIVASSFITSRTKVSHCLLKSFTKAIPFDLSQSPLLTLTISPLFIVSPPFDKKLLLSDKL